MQRDGERRATRAVEDGKTVIKVVIESPFAGDVQRNLRYLRACMRDCLLRGETPYASHALYTQPGVLRDDVPEERKLGMEAGFVWGASADKVVLYEDLGITEGMRRGVLRARERGQVIEHRMLDARVLYVVMQEPGNDY